MLLPYAIAVELLTSYVAAEVGAEFGHEVDGKFVVGVFEAGLGGGQDSLGIVDTSGILEKWKQPNL